MRIVYVTPSYSPRIGGVEYVAKSVAERLAKMGHEVTVVTGEPEAEKPREEEINGVHVIRWPTWAPSGAYHIPRMRSQLEKLLTDTARGADVVHAHNVYSIFTTYAALAFRATAKLVVTPHCHGTGHTACNNMDFSRGRT
jgi:glycosyltransferase involved in cell wall biosynthesis